MRETYTVIQQIDLIKQKVEADFKLSLEAGVIDGVIFATPGIWTTRPKFGALQECLGNRKEALFFKENSKLKIGTEGNLYLDVWETFVNMIMPSYRRGIVDISDLKELKVTQGYQDYTKASSSFSKYKKLIENFFEPQHGVHTLVFSYYSKEVDSIVYGILKLPRHIYRPLIGLADAMLLRDYMNYVFELATGADFTLVPSQYKSYEGIFVLQNINTLKRKREGLDFRKSENVVRGEVKLLASQFTTVKLGVVEDIYKQDGIEGKVIEIDLGEGGRIVVARGYVDNLYVCNYHSKDGAQFKDFLLDGKKGYSGLGINLKVLSNLNAVEIRLTDNQYVIVRTDGKIISPLTSSGVIINSVF